MVGADLNLVNEAARQHRRNHVVVEEALTDALSGSSERAVSDERRDRRRTAYHEAHAIAWHAHACRSIR